MSYQVKAAEVSKLRGITGAGMMDCKKALVEAEGDFDKAIEILRKKGQKVAANRADRESTEGAVITAVNSDKTKGALIALNCETDFVAKNEDFVNLAHQLAELALEHSSKEDFLAADFQGMSVSEKMIEQTGVIGEKIEIGAFETMEGPFLGHYVHNGNKIATLVALNKNTPESAEVAKNVAMQVAAMNPLALDESGIDQTVIDKEIEIAKDQLRQEGKPEAMLDNIAKGKLQKFFKENTLNQQEYIVGDKQSVKDYVKSANADLEIVDYKRYSL
ncbi:MAG: translation elongation factor Ts [Weeksellaceae bacterium]|nr:translation elongation factor Ts [Weeksellaceae bacterium]